MNDRRMFYGANSEVFRKAYLLRSRETEVEKLLWNRLNKNQLGCRFKRQHPIANYVADFYCHKAKTVIELDGQYHSRKMQKAKDLLRETLIKELGLSILRFSDQQVIENIDEVVYKIRMHISSRETAR